MSEKLQEFKDAFTKKAFTIDPVADIDEKTPDEVIVAEIRHDVGDSPITFVSETKPIRFYLDDVLYEADISGSNTVFGGGDLPALPAGGSIYCKEISQKSNFINKKEKVGHVNDLPFLLLNFDTVNELC